MYLQYTFLIFTERRVIYMYYAENDYLTRNKF